MNARDQAHRTTVAVTSGLAVAALATTVTVGLMTARSEDADSSATVADPDTSSSTTQSDTQSDQSNSGSSGSPGLSPGNGSADATSGGS